MSLYFGYDQFIAKLEIGKINYRGEGDTPQAAIEALVADIEALSPNLVE